MRVLTCGSWALASVSCTGQSNSHLQVNSPVHSFLYLHHYNLECSLVRGCADISLPDWASQRSASLKWIRRSRSSAARMLDSATSTCNNVNLIVKPVIKKSAQKSAPRPSLSLSSGPCARSHRHFRAFQTIPLPITQPSTASSLVQSE